MDKFSWCIRGANTSKKNFVTFFKEILKIWEKPQKSQKSQKSIKKSLLSLFFELFAPRMYPWWSVFRNHTEPDVESIILRIFIFILLLCHFQKGPKISPWTFSIQKSENQYDSMYSIFNKNNKFHWSSYEKSVHWLFSHQTQMKLQVPHTCTSCVIMGNVYATFLAIIKIIFCNCMSLY